MRTSKKCLICALALWLALGATASASGLFDGLLPSQNATAAPSNSGSGGLFDGLVSPSQKVLTHQEQEWLLIFEKLLGVSPTISFEGDDVWAAYAVPGSGSYTLLMYTQDGLQMLAFSPIALSGLEGVLDAVSQAGTLMNFDYDQELQCIFLALSLEKEQAQPQSPQATKAPALPSSYRCAVCHDLKDCPECLGFRECSECFGEKEYSCTYCIGGECLACDDGQILVGFDAKDRPRYQKCSQCSGGKCRFCGGDGYMQCTLCRGTGKCPTCGGDGKCPSCQ